MPPARIPAVLALLLALWVQSVAPGLALRLSAPADPGLAAICGRGLAPASLDAQGPAQGACAACPFCASGPTSPPLPDAPQLARVLRWSAPAWPIPPPGLCPNRQQRTVQPRGPPRAL